METFQAVRSYSPLESATYHPISSTSPTIAIRAGLPSAAIELQRVASAVLSSLLCDTAQPSGCECHSPTYSRPPWVTAEISSKRLRNPSEPRMYRCGHSRLSGGDGIVPTTWMSFLSMSNVPNKTPPVSFGSFDRRIARSNLTVPASVRTRHPVSATWIGTGGSITHYRVVIDPGSALQIPMNASGRSRQFRMAALAMAAFRLTKSCRTTTLKSRQAFE